MVSQAPNTYDYELDVAAEDIDEMGHVNNAVYLTWVQAAVLRHWRRLAPRDVAASHRWVALQHRIRYRRPAFLDDHVVVRVVLQRMHGARAVYRTMIRHGDQLLAEVESSWCCIDAVSKKPVRLARDIVARFLPA
ncbi:MAG: acyl-CoA thioesterase [Rhodobacteraceae bacterium]|nr:acyl-CoA thioesterase [Paracoccaceae bacterium]